VKNTLVFDHVICSLDAPEQQAFEVAWLRTTCKVNAPGTNWRRHFAIVCKF
jgi:hypothetical protein